MTLAEYIDVKFRKWWDRIADGFSVARHLSHDEVAAVWSEVLIAAWRSGWNVDHFESDGHIRGWIIRIGGRRLHWAARVRSRSLRAHGLRRFSDMDDHQVAAFAFLSRAEPRGTDARIVAAWEALTPLQREILQTVTIEGNGWHAAGRVLKRHPGNILIMWRGAVKRLRKQLAKAA